MMYVSHDFTFYQIPPWHLEQDQSQTRFYTEQSWRARDKRESEPNTLKAQ